MRWGRARAQKPDSVREKASSRLKQVGDFEVVNWAEQAVNVCHANLDAYRRTREGAALDEARKAVSSLAGALDVLETRKQV